MSCGGALKCIGLFDSSLLDYNMCSICAEVRSVNLLLGYSLRSDNVACISGAPLAIFCDSAVLDIKVPVSSVGANESFAFL